MFVLPVSTDHPTRHKPYALGALVLINIAIYVLALINGGHEALFKEYGFIPATPSLATGFYSMFLHAGFWHLAGNMVFLCIFGSNVEDVLGNILFVFCFFVAGASSILLFQVFNSSSDIPLVGASGAISGIVGLYFTFFPLARAKLVIYVLYWELASIPTTAFWAIVVWFAEQSVLSLMAETTQIGRYTHTAFIAHVGGFLAGVALGFLFRGLGFVQRYDASGERHWLLGYLR